MRCVKCTRFTFPEEHLSSSGKLNKLCNKCLKHVQVENVHYIEDLEEIIILEDLFPLCYILIPVDKVDDYLIELGQNISQILLIEIGYKLR